MGVNVSAARSLREALPELLTLHRLNVPEELSKVLHTTNGIENLFSSVRHREHNIKNYNPEYRGKKTKGKLMQRWLAAVFLKAEENFRTVKGHEHVQSVVTRIQKLLTTKTKRQHDLNIFTKVVSHFQLKMRHLLLIVVKQQLYSNQ